ncbi:hypothetical protein Tco_0970851 [Tanacetum coccineum]
MDQDSAHMVAASKVPMLKPGEFELWRMRIEQYIQMIDYALWEVIDNGATLPKTVVVEGVEKVMPITSAEDKDKRRLEVKARSTLMMGISNENQLKFNSIKDAKLLLKAVEKRFGGNAATKKTQRNLLKQQYENFTAPSLEMLDQTFDRLQKLMKVKGMSSSSLNTQNIAFVSSSNNNTSSSNEAVNAAHGVSTASTQVNTAYSTNIDNLKEMDLRWQMAMLTMRARRPRESNDSSSSTTLNHPSSSHPLDDPIDEDDDESFHSNSSSPSQNISLSVSVVSFNVSIKNPPH